MISLLVSPKLVVRVLLDLVYWVPHCHDILIGVREEGLEQE